MAPAAAPGPARRALATGGAELRVLQFNLCHGGQASCYTGDAVMAQALAVMEREQPDIVSLNEVCRSDIDALAGVTYRGWFVPALDPADRPIACTNGEDYGIGMLHRVGRASAVFGVYAAQDGGGQRRAWMCSAFEDGAAACVTHLSTVAWVAMKQCHELLDKNVPAHTGGRAAVVAGDFNLLYNRSVPWEPNVQDCVPDGFFRAGDGSVQHVMASSAHLDLVATHVIDMQRTTDHPALLVRLRRR